MLIKVKVFPNSKKEGVIKKRKLKIMECRQKENLKNCPCTYPGCPRKGICCECIKHHLANNELPACCFSAEAEKTYDRSFKKFIEDKKK